MNDDIQRTLGDHGAQLANLTIALEKVSRNVDSLVASENKREGGKKVVWTIAALLGALSGGVADAFVTKWIK